jgi:hydrogenase nickel incorporation protein HypA/HybF
MHELSLAQSIVEILRQHVPAEQESSVTGVKVRVGALSGVVPESLEFCFGVVTQGTPLGSARLEIERVPAVCACRACGHLFDVEGVAFVCPTCGGGDVRVTSGQELQVVHLELAEPTDRQ